MSYITDVSAALAERLPDCGPDLLDLYTLLVFTAGTETTLEQVHDAWAVWRERTRPDHPALAPFPELAPEVQQLDRTYMEAIREVAVDVVIARRLRKVQA